MNELRPISDWLPTTVKEASARGWDELDVIIFSGDAYVDHPSFGSSVIGRIIESEGLKVAIVPQPNWQDNLKDFKKFGKPNMFFAVSAGTMDSMVNHYTASKRRRSTDAYTPDGLAGFRPDYATVVYTKILKEMYPEVPVLIGGIDQSKNMGKVFISYDGDNWEEIFENNASIRNMIKYNNKIFCQLNNGSVYTSVESTYINCQQTQELNYYDILGTKLNNNSIYNTQIIVKYKRLETGEISYKLEIRKR